MARLETVVHATRSSRQAEGLQDALVARQIAGEFAESGPPAPSTPGDAAPESGSLPDWWPKCPGCEAPRSASCPVCGTSGTQFEAIDMGFSLIEGLDDAAAAAGSSCGPGGCGSGVCSPDGEAGSSGGAPSPIDPSPTEGDDGGEHEGEMAAGMVICPTCDEPFEPEHPKLCEWCDHEFPDGFETPLPDDAADHDELTGRVYLVVGLLLAIAIGALMYFGSVVY